MRNCTEASLQTTRKNSRINATASPKEILERRFSAPKVFGEPLEKRFLSSLVCCKLCAAVKNGARQMGRITDRKIEP